MLSDMIQTPAREPARSAAEQVRSALRQSIIEGALTPGTRLIDASVALQHGVSRNTARDGLRLLEAEGLAVSTRNVGYSVRELTVEDIRDLYTARRIIEAGAVRSSVAAPGRLLEELEQAAEHTEACVRRGSWTEVGTASLDFHRRVVALGGSESLNTFFMAVAAQLRLAFSVIDDEAAFQLQWVPRDREIAEHILGGAREDAVAALDRYLSDSEVSVIDAVRASLRARRADPAADPAAALPVPTELPSPADPTEPDTKEHTA